MRSTSLAAPLLLELQRALLQRGAWPLLRVELPGQTRGFYEHAQDWQLDDFAPLALARPRRRSDRSASRRPTTPRALVGIARALPAPARAPRQSARRDEPPLVLDAVADAGAAEHAGMALEEFEAFVAGALFLDRADPVAAWGELRAFQDALIERLKAPGSCASRPTAPT